MRKNIERVREVRESVGPDFPIMIDCYMALVRSPPLAPSLFFWRPHSLSRSLFLSLSLYLLLSLSCFVLCRFSDPRFSLHSTDAVLHN